MGEKKFQSFFRQAPGSDFRPLDGDYETAVLKPFGQAGQREASRAFHAIEIKMTETGFLVMFFKGIKFGNYERWAGDSSFYAQPLGQAFYKLRLARAQRSVESQNLSAPEFFCQATA